MMPEEMETKAVEYANRWNSIHGDDWQTVHDEVLSLLRQAAYTPSGGIRVKEVAVWTESRRVVVDTDGIVWESVRDYEVDSWASVNLKGFLPWKRVVIG